MKKHDLYELIYTLSPIEKKVIREKFSPASSGNFIRLYNAIVKREVKNDADVKSKFAGEKFVSHLHKTKAYLYQAILDILHSQIKTQYSRLRIFHQLAMAETLLSRKLISEAEEVFFDTLKLIKASEETELELYTLGQLMAIKNYIYEEQSNKSLVEVYKKIEQIAAYHQLFFEVFEKYSERGIKPAVSLEQYKNHSLLKEPAVFLSKSAQRFYVITQSLLYSVWKDYKQAANINVEIVKLIEPIASVFPRCENAYVSALFNAAIALQNIKANDKAIIQKLEKYHPLGIWAKSHRFTCLVRLKLNAYLIGNKNAKGKILIKWAEQELAKHQHMLNDNELVKVQFYIASLLLKEQEFNKALDYLLQIYNANTVRKKRPIIFRATLIYQMIANYELNNMEVLETLLRKHSYFQKKNDAFYFIETLIHEFLVKAIQLKNKKQRNQEKQLLVKKLKELPNMSINNGLEYLQKIDWLD